MRAAWLALGFVLLASPSRATTSLELGNAPNLSLRLENQKLAVGFGFGVSFSTGTTYFVGFPEKETILVIDPAVTGQMFLNREPKARSFLELTVEKGVPIGQSQSLRAIRDDWSVSAGLGLRSAVAERLSLGGALDFGLRFATVPGQPSGIIGGTGFRVFVQYAL